MLWRHADSGHLQATQGKGEAQLLLIAAAVLAIDGAGIAACFTAIGHVDAVLRSELPEFSWKRWHQRAEFDWDAQEVGSTYHKNRRNREEVGRSLRNCRSARRSNAKRQEFPTTLRMPRQLTAGRNSALDLSE